MSMLNNDQIISRELRDGKLEVVVRRPSNTMYACNPPRPVPDNVWKEIYIATDSGIVLDTTIAGSHTPGEFIGESFTFPETAKKE